MKLTARHHTYWRHTRLLTMALLALWVIVTFVAGYFARELNGTIFLGFPLGFYVFAQGALIAYLVIIAIYVWAMERLERRYGAAE